MSPRIRCDHCADVIGVYEPLVLVVGGESRETSRAAEPALPFDSAEHYHRTCFLERIEPRE
jgi:hypothetical protein